ncbi:uncharacterized protein LOC142224725 [Haematobia irritans]|uniref:uncharacterized protein LOC142224725 n=1 Tax=Haematobia irritans TaxID=7368 RepID=UPI003F502B4E
MDRSKSEKFANSVNDLNDFESTYAVAKTTENVRELEAVRAEIETLWSNIKKSYLDCRDHVPLEGEKPIDKTKLRAHYSEAMETYKRIMSSVNADILALKDQVTKDESLSISRPSDSDFASGLRLPPCDTDTFKGGYTAWPSFRDLFTAIYIKNSRLSNVEKLFHLTQKTAGEAREIISNVPLTNEGFTLAWKNLIDRYENRRMQVNEQLKLLFNLPNVNFDSSQSIQKLQRTVNSCMQTLETLGVEVKDWDPILIFLCSSKLPRPFLEEFENSLEDCKVLPNWNIFDKFLKHKFKTLESVGNIKPIHNKHNQQNFDGGRNRHDKPKFVNSFHTNVSQKLQFDRKRKPNSKSSVTQPNQNNQNPSCQLCKATHFIRDCPKFIEKSINDRIHVVKVSHLCYNCLSSNHGVKDCKSKFTCRECSMRHHTMLHKGTETQTLAQDPVSDAVRPSTSTAALATQIQSTPSIGNNVMTLTLQNDRTCGNHPRGTLLFTALVQIESRGQLFDARAIIDSGSQSTFISEKLKNKLALPTKRNLIHVTGVSQMLSETSTKSCLFTLRSRLDTRFKLEVWAPVLKALPSHLPPQNLDLRQLGDVANLDLADPKFYISQPVDLLIGMDIGPLIFDIGSPMRSIGTLLAQNTVFGWIIGGPMTNDPYNNNRISLHNTVAIEQVLTRFWEMEETPKKILRSEEDMFCESNFKQTTKRNSDGRYVVSLPFKKCHELGSSRNIAMAQFYRMETKLMKTPDLKEQYDKSILEYLELGHMRKISAQEITKAPNYYLPHHAVVKPDRLTTKLRVVFNASNPTSNKSALNDTLYTGPILQQNLVLQILKWRFFKYVFNADITKMYRQILLDPNQTQYQRILFRKSPADPVEDFELLTVTFGVNCAPFLAIRTLLQLAEDVADTHPIASKIIQENLYVDDVLAGAHTIDEAIASRKELILALESAGFKLMKWTANDHKIIQELPNEKLLPVNWLDLSEDSSAKTLGVRWNISGDFFTFTQPTVEVRQNYTKRQVLSTIAKLFDPCGWLAPVIVVAKLVMQQIWLDKIDWDDPLKTITLINWQKFVKTSSAIDSVKIPRWIHFVPNCNIEIHGFCDASESAYGAALYIRVEFDNHNVETHLLAAKTRVAPIKKLSLPRLELSWLKKPPCAWSTFVGNRVSEIIENVGNDKWQHVDSENNPADIASRGCSPFELKENYLWWHGPSWLKLDKQNWPIHDIFLETNMEAKAVKVLTTSTFEDPLIRFSSLSRAYRVLSYVLRFWRNTSSKRDHLRISSIEVTAEEIQDVKRRLIIMTQKQYYPHEYNNLQQKLKISSTSSLLTMNPFLDSHGIMRANGRLVQAPVLSYSERHPIILPYDAPLTDLIVNFTHKIAMHWGNQLTIRILRSEFWIFRLKPLVKKIIHNCKTCILFKRHTQSQIMGALPPERTMLSRPFANTGIDFAGPFDIKHYKTRSCFITKGYVCIFVCFATKAVHLEATTDLSSQSFLAAFSRFIARRGCPSCVYSDNGKNFFIPPGAPHMGGLWEAGVKSFKTHLRKFIPKMSFTFEELSTILARIESCLNSRPLSTASDDPNDFSPLTPGHFLIGTSMLAPAEPDVSDQNLTLANRWKRLKIVSQYFCMRWKSEYLKELHRRTKWKSQQDNIKENDLVVIKDDRFPPTDWAMGRIEKTYPGTDQNIRVVDIRTSRGMAAYLPRRDAMEDEPMDNNGRRPRPEDRRENRFRTRSGVRQERGRVDRPVNWQYSCGLCQEDHALSSCQRFLDKTPYQRYETVERRGYCRNCLARSHLAPDCPSLTACRRCSNRHHTLLHGATQLEDSLAAAVLSVPVNSSAFKWDHVFIPTAMIRVSLEEVDSWATVRALICQSSTMSRIAYSTFRRLGLRSFLHQGQRFTKIRIMPRRTNSTWALKVNALITDELPRRPYSDPLVEDPTRDFSDHSLADPDPRSNVPIDIELGADTYSAIHREGSTFTGIGDVNAYKTVLGYIISGPIRNLSP